MTGDPPATLSSAVMGPFLLRFLREHLGEPENLSSLPSLSARLKCECDDHKEELLHLNTKLSLALSSWISQSAEVELIFSGIESGPPLPSQGPPAIKPNLSLNDMGVWCFKEKSYIWSYLCLPRRLAASYQSGAMQGSETAPRIQTPLRLFLEQNTKLSS